MRICGVLSAMILFAVGALAQSEPGNRALRDRAPAFDELKDALQLHEQQLEYLKSVIASQREALQPLIREQAQRARDLRHEMKKEPVDPSRVSQLRGEIKAGRDQVNARRSEFIAAIRAKLTPTQLDKLADLEKALSLEAAARQARALGLIERLERPGPLQRLRRGRRWLGGAVAPVARPPARL